MFAAFRARLLVRIASFLETLLRSAFRSGSGRLGPRADIVRRFPAVRCRVCASLLDFLKASDGFGRLFGCLEGFGGLAARSDVAASAPRQQCRKATERRRHAGLRGEGPAIEEKGHALCKWGRTGAAAAEKNPARAFWCPIGHVVIKGWSSHVVRHCAVCLVAQQLPGANADWCLCFGTLASALSAHHVLVEFNITSELQPGLVVWCPRPLFFFPCFRAAEQ